MLKFKLKDFDILQKLGLIQQALSHSFVIRNKKSSFKSLPIDIQQREIVVLRDDQYGINESEFERFKEAFEEVSSEG